MSRGFKTAVLLLLLAMVPLRGLAAVTVGICGAGHHHQAVQQADHDHGGGHDHHGAAQDPAKPDCNMCGEHCASAAFAVAAGAAPVWLVGDTERPSLGEQFAAGFIPEHLDPPPLAL